MSLYEKALGLVSAELPVEGLQRALFLDRPGGAVVRNEALMEFTVARTDLLRELKLLAGVVECGAPRYRRLDVLTVRHR